MSTPTRSIVRLSALGLGALLIGLPATAARAACPTTAPDAEAMAQDASKQAAYYRSLGGARLQDRPRTARGGCRGQVLRHVGDARGAGGCDAGAIVRKGVPELPAD